MGLEIKLTQKLPNYELDVVLRCEPGRLLALVGPSGAGKTTIVRAVAGLAKPDQGFIALGPEVWYDSKASIWLPPQKRGLGYVFQEFTLFPHLTVEKNVAFAAVDKRRVGELLAMFGIGELAARRPQEISGGERQRVALAQALAREPKVLLLDEPFSALDIATRKQLQAELKELKASLNLPIIHVTHDLQEAMLLADDIVAIEAGRLSHSWLDRFLVHAHPAGAAGGRGVSSDKRTFLP
ncbi:MAG: ATP-binding cassette domain-containing protein [Desulfobulbaceae bacterium]|nr:ATP-binding cassette domain-containing protein [Desulfobulbaceae bacterium]HIJ79532.1 ATP-binding cassette domain-containing protein [Deltaproteobacteria bacterium]